MLVYLDSSVLARAYLPDEPGHDEAAELVYGSADLLVSATWTTVEVTSALTRASQHGRGRDLETLLAVLADDTGDDGAVTLLRADGARVEARATQIVRDHALRSLDALHIAVAELAARPLAEPGEQLGFASRDEPQRAAARALGFAVR